MSPAVEPRAPIINDSVDALSDLDCQFERLQALLRSATADLHEILEHPASVESLKSRGYDIWMILILASEKLEEECRTLSAISQKVHAEHRAVPK